jgi:hypothetical protein
MPKMPESEKKEESAESREEAKEQVRGTSWLGNTHLSGIRRD